MERNKQLPLLLFFLVIAIVIGFSLMLSRNKTSVAETLDYKTSVAETLDYKTSVAETLDYKGAEYCGLCHTEIYEGWNQTNHAHAVLFMQNASGNFYGIGAATNLEGTPAYRDETYFRNVCRNCHVTGGNNWDPINLGLSGANRIWPEWNTTGQGPAKFLNIQCEVCHGAYQSHGSSNPAMILNYSATLCEQCHTGASHGNSYSQSAHARSLADLLSSGHASDYCLKCMSAQGSLGLDVSLNTTSIVSVSCVTCHDPHSNTFDAQLRYEESTELCGQCHSQAKFFENSAHSKAGLECVSCHGVGTHFAHNEISPWLNHTWGIYGMNYPYNQTRAEEPIVCSTCHTQSWATSQLKVIQNLTTESITNATKAIEDSKATITIANQTSGVNQTKIDGAMAMVEAAENYLDDLERDNSQGFHNQEESYTNLIDATRLANAAKAIALQAQQETTQSSFDKTSSELLTLKGTTLYLYLGVGLLVGFAVGGVVIYAVRRKSRI